MVRPMSDLYHILSKYTAHGGSPDQLITAEWTPTRFSCTFVNRPDPLAKDLTRDLEVLANGCELLCIEVAFVHGSWSKKYGLQPSKVSEGGFFLTHLLGRGPESEMSNRIRETLHELGCPSPGP